MIISKKYQKKKTYQEERNIVNPYIYNFRDNSKYNRQKYDKIFLSEIIEECMLINFPEKYFTKQNQKENESNN